MRTRPTILFFGPVGEPVPDLVREWALGRSFPLEVHADAAQVESIVLRGHPCLLFIDADRMGQSGLQLVRGLKSDPFTAIIPALKLSSIRSSSTVSLKSVWKTPSSNPATSLKRSSRPSLGL